MRAIILAAGRGLRLQLPEDQQQPKCLLRFGGMSLIERHLRMLRGAGVDEVVLAVGYRRELVEAEIERLDWRHGRKSFLIQDLSLAVCSRCTPPPMRSRAAVASC